MNVPLLPADKIVEGFECVKAQVNQQVMDPKRIEKWNQIFCYVNREWVRIVKPANLSVFKALDRTDNHSETYHRDVNRDMGMKPNCPTFIRKICKFLYKM